LREEDGMFENRFLRKILGPKKDEVAEGHWYFIRRNVMICTPQ
jgi:hypothetical protein